MATPTREWWRRVTGCEQPDEATRAVLTGGRVGYGLARVGEAAVGAVRAAVTDRWLHLARLTVDPDRRRRGFAAALICAAADWGRRRGAERAVVQVLADNDPAIGLYTALGLAEHHSYTCWVPSSPPNRSVPVPRAGPAASV